MKRFVIILSVSLFLLMNMGWAQTYTLTDLGVLPGATTDDPFALGPSSSGNAVNRLGKVAGYSSSRNGYSHAAFFNKGSAVVDLGTLPDDQSSYASAINDSNQVAGTSTAADGNSRAVLFYNGTVTALPMLASWTSSAASGINKYGDVTGTASGSFGTHVFLYSAGSMQDLGTPPGFNGSCWSNGYNPSYISAIGINDYGVIAGTYAASDCTRHAFLYVGGTFQDLGVPTNCSSSFAMGLNNSGQVAGFASGCPGFSSLEPFLYDTSGWHDLGVPSDNYAGGMSLGINNLGQAVGFVDSTESEAALWANGTATNLNCLLNLNPCAPFPPNSSTFGHLFWAYAINDSGQITGYGQTGSGAYHAFLLTPVKTKKQ